MTESSRHSRVYQEAFEEHDDDETSIVDYHEPDDLDFGSRDVSGRRYEE